MLKPCLSLVSEQIPPPSDLPLDDILPAEPLLLMGAGPVPIPKKVATANSVVINHLGDTMSRVIGRVRLMAQYVFQTHSPYCFGISGPASAAMEMAITNLIWPGRKVLCIQNGWFSERFVQMARRVGGDCTVLEAPAGEGVEPAAVEAMLASGSYNVITIVHGETSSTVLNRHLPEICRMATRHGVMSIVDGVCTLSTMPLAMDDCKADVVVTGGQKGLSSIPGVSLIAFSETAWQAIESRQAPMPHWCLDARLAQEFWLRKGYHYTAPVSGILALHEALRLICLETLPQRFQRHFACSKALQAGLEAMGLRLYAREQHRLNSVIGICLPDGIAGKSIITEMSSNHGVEISGSFGANIVRIGQMGEQCRVHHILRTVHALGASMQKAGASLDLALGMSELERALSE